MVTFFTGVFYAIGAVFILYNLVDLTRPGKAYERRKKWEKATKEKAKDWESIPEGYKGLYANYFIGFVLLLWNIIGLFTFQWALFLAFLVVRVLFLSVGLELSKKARIVYTGFTFANRLTGVMFGVFVILNKYHLHIDITHYLTSIF